MNDLTKFTGMSLNDALKELQSEYMTVRIIAKGQPIIENYDPIRVNVMYDSETKTVENVYVG